MQQVVFSMSPRIKVYLNDGDKHADLEVRTARHTVSLLLLRSLPWHAGCSLL